MTICVCLNHSGPQSSLWLIAGHSLTVCVWNTSAGATQPLMNPPRALWTSLVLNIYHSLASRILSRNFDLDARRQNRMPCGLNAACEERYRCFLAWRMKTNLPAKQFGSYLNTTRHRCLSGSSWSVFCSSFVQRWSINNTDNSLYNVFYIHFSLIV